MKATWPALWGACFLFAGSGLAQTPAPNEGAATAEDKPSKDAAKPKTQGSSNEVRRDPEGIKGINPFWEAVNEGDRAFIARDYDAAITAYRRAITERPQDALGHLRMAEAELNQGRLKQAEESVLAAVRFAGDRATIKGKALFLLAEVKERQAAYDEATRAWTNYEQHAKEQPKAKTYAATATERKQRVATRKQMVTDYAAVKERIEKRLKELDDEARKNAK